MVRNEAESLKRLPLSERVKEKNSRRFWIPSGLFVFVVTEFCSSCAFAARELWSYAAAFTAIAAVLYFESVRTLLLLSEAPLPLRLLAMDIVRVRPSAFPRRVPVPGGISLQERKEFRARPGTSNQDVRPGTRTQS